MQGSRWCSDADERELLGLARLRSGRDTLSRILEGRLEPTPDLVLQLVALITRGAGEVVSAAADRRRTDAA